MITVTERAKDRFSTIKPAGVPEEEVMRLDKARATAHGDETKLAVYLGEPEEGDQPIKHRGESLLFVSSAVSEAFDGCVVDLLETPEGTSVAIGPPEAGRDAR